MAYLGFIGGWLIGIGIAYAIDRIRFYIYKKQFEK